MDYCSRSRGYSPIPFLDLHGLRAGGNLCSEKCSGLEARRPLELITCNGKVEKYIPLCACVLDPNEKRDFKKARLCNCDREEREGVSDLLILCKFEGSGPFLIFLLIERKCKLKEETFVKKPEKLSGLIKKQLEAGEVWLKKEFKENYDSSLFRIKKSIMIGFQMSKILRMSKKFKDALRRQFGHEIRFMSCDEIRGAQKCC